MICEVLQQKDHGELMQFLNRAFGFDEEKNGFLTFLPKLYRREYDPCRYQLAIKEDGRICAAAGLYPVTLHAAGEELTCCAIGNVAVDPACRGKGMMSFLMSEAVQKCFRDEVDLACLGGQRQRYALFGFEPAGTDDVFTVTKTNIRHCFGTEPHEPLTVREIGAEETALLAKTADLYRSQPYYVEREPERLYDILCSWNYRPYAILRGEELIGYCLRKQNEVRELILADRSDLNAVLCALVNRFGDLNLVLPSYCRDLLLAANAVAEEYRATHWEKFSVYRFAKVIRAMLKLKAAEEGLCDGSLSFCVNGLRGAETFTVTVQNGVPEVTPAAVGATGIELSYKEAMEFFFSEFSGRRAHSPATHGWFPLALTLGMADHT